MDPRLSRRELLVRGSGVLLGTATAGLPFLADPTSLLAQARGNRSDVTSRDADPVMAALMESMTETVRDFQTRGRRPEQFDAFIATGRIHAAHSRSRGHDRALRRAAEMFVDRNGRAALIDAATSELMAQERRNQLRALGLDWDGLGLPRPTPLPRDKAEDTLNRIFAGQDVLSDHLDATFKQLQRLRPRLVSALGNPPHATNVQYGGELGTCFVITTMIQGFEAYVPFICAMSVFAPEIAPICALLMMELAVLHIWKYAAGC